MAKFRTAKDFLLPCPLTRALRITNHPAEDPKTLLKEQLKLEASEKGKQAPAHTNKAW